jgi:hypothetical protein
MTSLRHRLSPFPEDVLQQLYHKGSTAPDLQSVLC